MIKKSHSKCRWMKSLYSQSPSRSVFLQFFHLLIKSEKIHYPILFLEPISLQFFSLCIECQDLLPRITAVLQIPNDWKPPKDRAKFSRKLLCSITDSKIDPYLSLFFQKGGGEEKRAERSPCKIYPNPFSTIR